MFRKRRAPPPSIIVNDGEGEGFFSPAKGECVRPPLSICIIKARGGGEVSFPRGRHDIIQVRKGAPLRFFFRGAPPPVGKIGCLLKKYLSPKKEDL